MDMETPELSGPLLIPSQSGFSLNRISKKKSTNQKICLLFKASRHGMERIEICEKDDTKNPKIITLENCVKITHEPSPANLIHIVTKTDTLTINTLNEDDLKEWLAALQKVAFRDKISPSPPPQLSRHSVIEEDNDLYCTSYTDGMFTVKLVPSDTTTKCNLETKIYILHLTTTDLQLKSIDDNSNLIAKFPYRYIRKYGYRDGKFTFEAGRKCDTGEGVFSLEHSNPQEVFRCMAAKMKSMKKLINGDNTMASLDCGEHQFNAALSMEAGSRSPLPPSPNHHSHSESDLNHQSSHLIRGFLSSNDSLNNVSLSQPIIPLIQLQQQQHQQQQQHSSQHQKHIPHKPPRKSLGIVDCVHEKLIDVRNAGNTSTTKIKYNKFQNYEPITPPTPGTPQDSTTSSTSSSLFSICSGGGSSLSSQKSTSNIIHLKSPGNNDANKTFLHSLNSTNINSQTLITPPPPTTTTTNCNTNRPQFEIINDEQPPRLPVRNESRNCEERDYESIENITNAWRTRGIDDIKHIEHFSVTTTGSTVVTTTITTTPVAGTSTTTTPTSNSNILSGNFHILPTVNDDISDFVWQRSQSQKDFGVVTVSADGKLKLHDDYDRLQFFPTKSTPQTSNNDYKTIVTISPIGHKRLVDKNSDFNDYEIIGSPDTTTCRLADDSYLGYGILRKSTNTSPIPPSPTTHIPLLNNTTSGTSTLTISSAAATAAAVVVVVPTAPAIHQPAPLNQTIRTATKLLDDHDHDDNVDARIIHGGNHCDDDLLNHRKYNGLDYAIVSKPKRV